MTADERRERLGVLLEQALAVRPAERARFLDENCGDDAALRGDLVTLVEASESSSGYFEKLADQIVAPALAAVAGLGGDAVGIGETVSHYRIIERIGGGMGVVYKAVDLELGRAVALKFLPPQLAADETARRRLHAEARAASALDHPNIGVVHEIGEAEPRGLFLALAWYDGETLKETLKRGPLPVPDAVALARQIAAALAAAHEAGIIHRDVKPANIIGAGQGVAKLVDFGIAKVTGSEPTREGTTAGTVAYMSPEQTRGGAIDPRADLWSLGVVLYEMLTGRRPFRGEDEQAVIYAIRHDEPEPIESLLPGIPRALAGIVGTCLVKDPSGRYARAVDLLADLEALDEKRFTGLAHRRSRRLRLRGVAVMAAVVVLAVSGYLISARSDLLGLAARRVVVTPFDNRTGDASLEPVGRMAADWITQGLAYTGLLDVVPVTAALTAARFVSASYGGEDTAERIRRLATETGAGIVVSGAYYRQRDSLYLQATVTDAARGRVLYALEPVAAPNALPLAAVGELRRRLMGMLASSLNPRMQDHAARPGAAPPSYDAYLAYAEGLERGVARDWRGAIRHFAEAAQHDSSFIAPILYSGISYWSIGNWAAVDSMLVLARPRLRLLDASGRQLFEFLEAMVGGDLEAAYRANQRFPQIVPGGIAHWGLANSAVWVNRPRETVRVSRQLDPDRGELRGWFLYWRDLGRAHHQLGEHRDELRMARRARKRFPDEPQAVWLEMRALIGLRRHRQFDDLLSRQVQSHPNPALLLRQAGLELLAHGSAEAGKALLRESLQRHRDNPSETAGQRVFLAQGHLLVGEHDEAERVLGALVSEFPRRVDVQGLLGVFAALRGDTAQAASISSRLATLDRPYLHGSNTWWSARIASTTGEREQAIQLLRQAFREGMDLWDLLHTEPDLAPLRDYPPFLELMRPKG